MVIALRLRLARHRRPGIETADQGLIPVQRALGGAVKQEFAHESQEPHQDSETDQRQ